MQNKSHDHVKKMRVFSKGRTRSELTITPIRGTLTKSIYELVFGHSPQTIIIGVVKTRYPRDVEHVRHNIRSDHNARTLNASRKLRY